MREHATNNNRGAFHSGAPSNMSSKHKDELFRDVRSGMGLDK